MKINFKQTALAAVILGVFSPGSVLASVLIDEFSVFQEVRSDGNSDSDTVGPTANAGSDFATRTMMTEVLETSQTTTGISAVSEFGVLSINKDSKIEQML